MVTDNEKYLASIENIIFQEGKCGGVFCAKCPFSTNNIPNCLLPTYAAEQVERDIREQNRLDMCKIVLSWLLVDPDLDIKTLVNQLRNGGDRR